MFKFAKDHRLPLYLQLHDELAASIANNRWRPGEAIPTEAELVQYYGVSIGTVRKAVDMLVNEQALERFQGRGTFVRRAKFDSALFRFFRFQSENGERVVPQGRVLDVGLQILPENAALALKLPAGETAIHISRLRVMGERPLLCESIWLPKEKFAALLDVPLIEFGNLLYPFYEERCGLVVASAEENLTVEPVAEREAAYLQIELGTPVITVERTAYGYDHQPLEWRRYCGPASEFRYHVEIR